MVDFDAELLIVVEKWLGGSSSNNDIRLMLIANQYKTFDNFRGITPKMITVMEREIRPGLISKLKEVHALHLEEILDWICYMETNNATVVDNPLLWDMKDLRQWRRDGRPTNATPQLANPTTATGNTTTAQEKQQ